MLEDYNELTGSLRKILKEKEALEARVKELEEANDLKDIGIREQKVIINSLEQEVIELLEELKEVIQAAFYKGEDWGVTYQSWFTPSEDEHRDKLNAAKREILNRVKATVK